MTASNQVAAIEYDPFDLETAIDPYPLYGRLRDEAPLYHNERLGFYALSRFEDVERALVNRQVFINGHGSTLSLLASDARDPAGYVGVRRPANPCDPSWAAVEHVHSKADQHPRT